MNHYIHIKREECVSQNTNREAINSSYISDSLQVHVISYNTLHLVVDGAVHSISSTCSFAVFISYNKHSSLLDNVSVC